MDPFVLFLARLEPLAAGAWLGAYLYATFVVTPAMRDLPFSPAEQIVHRKAFGRRYGPLALVMTAVWAASLAVQAGTPNLGLRWAALLALVVISALHVGVFSRRMMRAATDEIAGRAGAAELRAGIQAQARLLTYLGLLTSFLVIVLLAWPR